MQYSKYDADIYKLLEKSPASIRDKWLEEVFQMEDLICHQGEVYDYFYIILEGRVDITIAGEHGRKYSQAIYGEGDFFGELEIFDRKPFISSIEALDDPVRIVKLHRKYFFQWLEEDRDFYLYIMRQICSNYYELSEISAMNILYSLKYRICNYILRKEEGGKLALDKEDISRTFAVTPRSINRVLRELKDKGIIDIVENEILIRNLPALKREEETSKNT